MPRDDWLMGSVAAQDTYNPDEGAFQAGIRATPWYDEFVAKFGEAPDLNTPDYNYRAAWAAGARPTVRDPGDQLLHWDSRFKGENHPNRYVNGVDTRMGDLAATDVYDAFDVPLEQTYDRRLDQTWPGRLAQEAIGAVLAPGRALQATEPITTEQMIKPAVDLAGLVTGGSYAAPAQRGASGAGIRAYHSSPHDFDKFDLAKIGTGEGAQVYGHGLYFAESPAVSGQGGQYWQQFAPRFEGAEGRAAKALEAAKFDRETAINLLNKTIERQLGVGSPPEAGAIQRAQQAIKLLESGQPVGPRTYEVEIKADPAHMLDWEKPLSAQPQAVRDVLERAGDLGSRKAFLAGPGEPTGQNIYSALSPITTKVENSRLGPLTTYPPDPVRASAMLREAGIPGIKYLDQGSRAAGTGSSNYVVFDPGIIDIMKKYGIVGAAPVGMGALAAQDRYE